MNFRRAAVFCLLLLPSLLTADVTLQYTVETKLSPSLPAAVTQMMAPLRAAIAPSQRTIAVQGGKLYAALGPVVTIADLPNNQITLLDPATHHFAIIPASDYANEVARTLPQLPASVKAILSSLKMTADSKVTGRTAEIQGMQAAERQITLSLNLAMPGAPPSSSPSPMMKVVLQIWLAQPDEVAHNPALREYIASGPQSLGGLNPADEIQKMASLIPGMADGLSSFMKELADAHSLALRTHASVYMPILAMLASRPSAAGNPGGAFDPNSPMVEMNEELTEISTAPIADSMFAIPEGYTAAPVADIVSAMSPKVTPPAAPASASQAGLVQPSVLTRTLPGYTEDARAKKIEGAVILSALVGIDGKPQDIQVVQSLDPGLDRKAIEAVGQWVFRPGTRDGVPVKVRAQIVVNFRLLERPPAPPQ